METIEALILAFVISCIITLLIHLIVVISGVSDPAELPNYSKLPGAKE